VKPLNSWIVKRLKVLAEVTGAQVPSGDALARLGETLSGFSEAIIDGACRTLEDAPQGEYRRMPTPDELVRACQAAARVNRPAGQSFNHDAYMRQVRAHPQDFISVADCIREVLAKRRAEGKPVWDFVDPRAGDAA
jgi:hypothetical protein